MEMAEGDLFFPRAFNRKDEEHDQRCTEQHLSDVMVGES
jgi:hypothetical protein